MEISKLKSFMLQFYAIVLLQLCIILSCNEQHKEYIGNSISHSPIKQIVDAMNHNSPICYYESIMIKNGLVDIQHITPSIQVDLKYASTDNFMNKNMYGCLRKAYLQTDVAHRLDNCQSFLQEKHPGYSLLVYDAARPVQVQQIMWDALDLPINEKVKFLSNPRNGSIHNFGAAVDVTIVNSYGNILDMGTSFDYMGEEAYPILEWQMLQQNRITKEHIENRNLLRSVMRHGGFWGIQTEWWHFNAMSRDAARERYNLIQ